MMMKLFMKSFLKEYEIILKLLQKKTKNLEAPINQADQDG